MTCGGGVKTRTRSCDRKCDNVINDDLTQTTSCNDHDCPFLEIPDEKAITFDRNPVAVDLNVPKHFRLTFEGEIINLF